MKIRLVCLCFLLGVFLPSPGLFAQALPVSLSINASAPGNRVGEDFVGFSMEQYTLSTGKWGVLGSFWTGGTNGNARLKNLLGNISPHSIIRLGGFTADDRMVWQNSLRGSSTNVRATYQDDVDKFFTFLSEVGWKGIYTIGLPNNTPANAVSEATYIMNKYSNQLHSISLGNEPYLYTNIFRPSTYNPETYMQTDYLPMYDAIKAANPAIPISGGDNGARKYYGAQNQTWNKSFTDYINNSGSSRPLAGLNVHSYGLGNNSNTLTRDAAADTLMNFDNAPLIFKSTLLPYVTQLAQAKNVALRFSETSSAATGTSDMTNVSHTYVSALWALQYLYTLASNGVSGVNFHSSGSSVYSAIDWGPANTVSAYNVEAIYYGLLAFVDGARNRRLLSVTPSESKTNPRASYFATTSDDSKTLTVTLINKDFTNAINASVNIPGITIGTVSYQTLRPQNDKYDMAANTFYANAQVAADGRFTKSAPTPVELANPTSFSVTIAPMTAVIATITLQSLPVAGSGSNTVPNAGGTARVNVPPSTFTNLTSSTVASPATITGLRIVGFPTNTTTLTLNGMAYTASSTAFGGANPTGVVVPVDGSGAPAVGISVDPTNDANPVSFAFKAVASGGIESGNTGTAVLNFTPVPDLSILLYTLPSTLYGTANFNVVVNVLELNSVATNGLITVYLAKDPQVSLSFNSAATNMGGRMVQNNLWTFDGTSHADFYILTTPGLGAGGLLSFGLDGVLTPGPTKGTLTISSILVGGGEVNVGNNSDADQIQYFQR
ncbi:hypothetical protein [Spirosoma endophyticum]|uniref:Uncharacterized protein n=1 Tax=Spirosoma endophyticum TaxID=662367 RepID=A0A1I1MXX4_9BACT|nr:hypothetical protein [Spirosoma endophyticum]SFC90247.1 hypothetical protein SAMN05216167_102766 [Spirosoma endophyticum]